MISQFKYYLKYYHKTSYHKVFSSYANQIYPCKFSISKSNLQMIFVNRILFQILVFNNGLR